MGGELFVLLVVLFVKVYNLGLAGLKLMVFLPPSAKCFIFLKVSKKIRNIIPGLVHEFTCDHIELLRIKLRFQTHMALDL